MLQNIRYAIRSYLRAPAFTAVAIITLALGIGGATAIFSIVDGILLRPLPYPESDQIVRVTHSARSREDAAFAPADFLDVKRDNTTFASVAGYREDLVDLTGSGEPVRVIGIQTTAGFFDVFGAKPLIGRTYQEASDRPGATLAVIGEGLWQRQFGRRTDIVGQEVRVNGTPMEIVGVVPEEFRHPLPADIWILSPLEVPTSPIPIDDALASREVQYFAAVARIRPGTTLAAANQDVRQIGERLEREFPDTNAGEILGVRQLSDALVQNVRPALLVLLGSVGLVLLIACANVAGLMLARGSSRRREMAVRASLGAGAGRLAAQLLIESLVLALVGGAFGLLVAAWGLDLLVALAPDTIPRLQEVRLDWRVAGTAFLVTTLVGLLFGLAPALQSARPALAQDLRDGGRTGTSGRTHLRSGLVVAEVAVALVLLIGAGLMLTSLLKLGQVDPGFHTSNLIVVDLPVPQARYDEEAQRRFYTGVLAAVRENPVTANAAIVFPTPLGGSNASAGIEIEGQPNDPQSPEIAELNAVSPEFFQTLGIRLIRGRTFERGDGPDRPIVALINERLAAQWGERDPIGGRINVGSWATVVGIVSDARRQSLESSPRPAIYLSYEQFILPLMGVMVRTEQPASAVASSVRAAATELDPDLPIGDVQTIEQIIEQSTGQPRFRTLLVLAFAGIAVLLAAVGVYGLISYSVSQRTAEMGVRLALGAKPWQVCGLVMRQGLWLAVAGVMVGLVGARLATRGLASLLFDTSATDPGIYAMLAAGLLTVAAVACYVPARRAMRVDPIAALRAE
jgi:putative ABC transport system permease protein